MAGPLRARAATAPRRAIATAPARSAHAPDRGRTRAGAGAGPFVAETADVHESATLGPGAVVLDGATVGARAVVGANSVVGEGVSIGEDTTLGFGVKLSNCTVGARCTLHHGVCVGQDGFGFYFDESEGRVVKVPQTLAVVIGDDVELGANTCVDRGSKRDTVIGNGAKLDNLVQVGHNAHVGEHCILCAHVALGGSSTLGERVVMGGKSAVADHVQVAPRSRIAAKAGVIKDVAEPGHDHGGFPAMRASLWRRQVALLRRMVTRGPENSVESM